MIATELKFVHVGMGNVINATRIVAMIRPNTQCAKRVLKSAKSNGMYIDACLSRSMKTLILMDDSSVVGSAITPKTLMKRCNGVEEGNITEDDLSEEVYETEEEDDESH